MSFNVELLYREYDSDAVKDFIGCIEKLEVADLENRLNRRVKYKQQSAANEEADKILHKQLLDKINQQFPN